MRGSRASASASHSLHRRPRDRVERAERLVEQQHRPARAAACEGTRPAGACRPTARPAAPCSNSARPKRSNRGSARRRASARGTPWHSSASAGVGERVAPGQQQVALGHVARQRRRWRRHRALVRLLEARDQLQQRRLAAARGPDDGHHLVPRATLRSTPSSAVDAPAIAPRDARNMKRLRHGSLCLGLHRSLRGHYPTGSKGQRRGCPRRYLSPRPRAPLKYGPPD